MIKTLLSWEILKDEVLELELILKLLESEIKLTEINTSRNKTDKQVKGLHEGIKSHTMCESIKVLAGRDFL